MKRLFTLLAACICISATAQQNVGFRQGNITSPIINEDNTVTFIINAPKAEKVEVLGYHTLGAHKWEMSEEDYPLAGVPEATIEDVKRAKSILGIE